VAKNYRVAVIGRTGRGNYGHNLDAAWKDWPGVEIVAVADENAEGLNKAAERLGVRATYSDYAQMLRQERPDIAVVAPRWVDCHLDMALAAAEAHASIFMEKPMARTPAECDRIIDACDRVHVKVCVAHNMRVCPILDVVQQRIAEGVIGDLQEIRGRGKEDRRAGGEDLMVLGTHVFDLMRRFGGDPLWAFGRVTAGGHEITRKDVVMDGPEGLGPIAGDAIAGVYAFANGLTGYFGSKRSSETSGKRFGVDLYGSRGILAVRAAHVPAVYHLDSVVWTDAAWKPLAMLENTPPRSQLEANQLLVTDLLEAIENDREPQAGGRTARWTIEMAMALYASQRTGRRVSFPLKRREHPLSG
jgi:predicted dehydrogenase